MPRHNRYCPANFPVHVIQRGNNRQICFTNDDDIVAYLYWLEKGAAKYEVSIHAWVFMDNHVHFLMTPENEYGISRLMQYMGRLYVRRFNHRYQRSGTLFEGRFRSSLVQTTEYFLRCMQYIEMNPVRAGMCINPRSHKWSSYHCHAFGKSAAIWSPHPLYNALGSSPEERQTGYRDLIRNALDFNVITKIRHCINTGHVLGTETFRDEIAARRR